MTQPSIDTHSKTLIPQGFQSSKCPRLLRFCSLVACQVAYPCRILSQSRKNQRLFQEQKEQERKDRTNRLCKRMGLFEKLLPDTIPLTEEQFQTFLEQTVLTEHSHRILDGLTAQNAVTAPAQGAETAAKGNRLPSKPPIQRRRMAQRKGNGSSSKAGGGACTPPPRLCPYSTLWL